MIKDFFTKFWKKKSIKKWDFLYRKEENDKNIYFIDKWKILLTINWYDIAIVWSWEISWEKSFLNRTWKPIDAKAIENIEVLYIQPEDFDSFSPKDKITLLKEITLFVSDRVYLLNNVISNISYINSYISNSKPTLNLEFFKNLFKNLIEIENTYIYKYESNAILPIFESKLNFDYRENLEIPEHEVTFKDNKIILKLSKFIWIIEIKENVSTKYVIENTLIHSSWILTKLLEKIEEIKNQQLSQFLE